MIILQILGLAALGHLAAEFFSQFDKLPNKPMKCNLCITFWLGILPLVYIHGYNGLFATAIASITSELIYRTINRI